MKYQLFAAEQPKYPVAMLVRYLNRAEIEPLIEGMQDELIAYQVTTSAKAKVEEVQKYLEELLSYLAQLQTEYVIVTDSLLFKRLTKQPKVSGVNGYIFPCVVAGHEHLKIVYSPSPTQLIYDPTLIHRIHQAMDAVRSHRKGTYVDPGGDIIKVSAFPQTAAEITEWLRKIVDRDLAVDIETFGLKHHIAGIGTISMAWNKHEGIAFPVDFLKESSEVRAVLKDFFEVRHKRSRTKTLMHNASFDAYVLIYQLFMDGLLDTEGLLYGMEVMLSSFVDTMLITYLATNTCAGNQLSLKEQAQEFAGNYAENVKDISSIPMSDLLTYNLKDSLSTWYVYEKNYPKMVKDQQKDLYDHLFSKIVWDVIQMQLTGLPIDLDAVARGKKTMMAESDAAMAKFKGTLIYQQAQRIINERWVEKRNNELKVKRVSMDDAKEEFNLNSAPQLQLLIYDLMGLPVIARTKTKQPATGSKTLKRLRNHTDNQDFIDALDAIIEFNEVDKLLSAFIPAFEQAPQAEDGHHYLFGFFNIGGTVSGRLSSNGPNLQQIPSSGNKYGSLIKQMFKAPKGWVFVGVDFNSLEDRISALTTKDPNKLKVYTDGYDGHSLRAFSYSRDQMPDIVDTVESINSIQFKYEDLRQESKAPTFALTYQGTYITLMKNLGWSIEKAQATEARFKQLYAASIEWIDKKLEKASKDGYVTVAFGLRVRTPLMHQTIRGNRSTPHEAEAEARTAGNAMGQSYGLLNSRAGNAFMRKVRASEYRLDIRPCAQIHDAQYYLVRDDINILKWVNDNLIKEIEWQDLPEIQHDQVKLGGTLSVFYPSWDSEISIPNYSDIPTIRNTIKEKMK